MNLKALLFNKSIFRTDLKRFWIASLLYGVILFFSVTFQYMAGEWHYVDYVIPKDYLMTIFAGNTYPGIVFGILCGGIFALMIFMYINSTPAISFYHSLPYRRSTIFFTKLLAGIKLLVVPVVINLFILMGVKASGTYIPANYSHLFVWMYLQLAYSIIVFLGVSFVAMFTGNFMYLIAVSGICVLTPLIGIAFTEGLLTENLFGYVGSVTKALDWVYLTPEYMLTPRAFIYLALGIIFIVLGFILYNKRNLERNGEAIVFNGAKVFFVYLIAFLCGIFSYWYFSSLIKTSVLWMLPFGIAGIIGANMINKKQITLKGFLKPSIIYAVCVLLLFLVFKFDLTGFERRVPRVEDIEEVIVDVPVYESRYSIRGSYYIREYYADQISGRAITKPEEIEKVTALHRSKTQAKGGKITNGAFTTIKYKLKNGRTLRRGYYIFKDEDKNLAEDVFMLDTMKDKRYHDYKKESINYQYITLYHDFLGRDVASYLSDTEEINELKEALHRDIANISYDKDSTLMSGGYGNRNFRLRIAFDPELNEELMRELAEEEKFGTSEEKPYIEFEYIINDGYPETMALIKKYGFYEKLPEAEDLREVYIRKYGDKLEEYQVTDTGDIAALYEIVLNTDASPEYYDEGLINIEIRTENNGFEVALPEEIVSEITDKYIKK